jgi:formate dehydrogenase major subunit
MEAKARGARVFHIDPRFTRTSAVADQHVALRAGSDIAFLGGVINYILSNELEFREYVAAYTNASFLVDESFVDTEDLDGLFSGYDPHTATYDPSSWSYESTAGGNGGGHEQASSHQHGSGGPVIEGASGEIAADPKLEHPRCVFQILKRHFARYTPEMVERVCGVPQHLFAEVCRAWTQNSGRERTAALVYSVGWTQHTLGAQYIRAGAIIQLLLGNIGRPGGGIYALRGHASIQGSTDVPTLFNLLPGYLPMPDVSHEDLAGYIKQVGGSKHKGFWRNADTYTVSLLKEYWGEKATADNDFCFDYLPRINGDHSTYRTAMDMVDGKVFGFFLLGQNPAVGSAHGRLQRLGMAELDWLVVRDLAMIESASFWKDAPEIETGEIVTEKCRTEVFFMPAASHVEKAGTFTQTQRMLQWRDKAVEPQDDQRSELWFAYHLGRRLREKLAGSADERDRPLLDLAWDYKTEDDDQGWDAEPDGADVLRRINGIDLRTGKAVSSYLELRADGSTACGCWIYSGVYAGEVNQARRRKSRFETGPYDAEWGWTWPANRRVLYNRASADPQGRPWSERKALVWWDADKKEWTGHDTPDFEKTKPPDYRPDQDAVGPAALNGDDAFIMQSDGKAWLFASTGMADGPLPTHYEPHESPARNLLYGQQGSPVRRVYGRADNPSNPSPPEAHGEVFPFVFTTARLTEHHTAGGMSRLLPYLSELQPALFVEISPELATERGLHHLDWAHVITSRSAVDARVFVTDRMAPLRIDDRVVHQVWMPYHWGATGLTTGDAVNDLIGVVADPNVFIQESKVLTCDIQPGRRPRGPALREYIADYRRRAGITTATGTRIDTAGDGVGPAHTEPVQAPTGPVQAPTEPDQASSGDTS